MTSIMLSCVGASIVSLSLSGMAFAEEIGAAGDLKIAIASIDEVDASKAKEMMLGPILNAPASSSNDNAQVLRVQGEFPRFDFPKTFHFAAKMRCKHDGQTSYMDKMFGYADVRIGLIEGDFLKVGDQDFFVDARSYPVAISTKFSNGRRLVSGEFNADIRFLREDRSEILGGRFTRSIGMAGFDGTNEKSTGTSFDLPPSYMRNLHSIEAVFYLSARGDIRGSSGVGRCSP